MIVAAIKDAGTEDALPLLAFVLRELYDRYASTRKLTFEAYRLLGDEQAKLSPLENAVRRKADEVLAEAKPTPEQLQALKEAFVPAMVRVNAEGEYVRRPERLEELPAPARSLIERLVNARLLVKRHEGDSAIVEVTHEALLRKWPLLRGWLDDEREFLIGKQQLEQDLRDWLNAHADHKSEALLSGLKLTRAREWLQRNPHHLTSAERDFIGASIAHHEAQIARRERARRIALLASVAACIVLLLAAGSAMWQWRAADRERVRAERHYDAAKIAFDSIISNLTAEFGERNRASVNETLEKALDTIRRALLVTAAALQEP